MIIAVVMGMSLIASLLAFSTLLIKEKLFANLSAGKVALVFIVMFAITFIACLSSIVIFVGLMIAIGASLKDYAGIGPGVFGFTSAVIAYFLGKRFVNKLTHSPIEIRTDPIS
ncbi:MAG: hypothetical protein PF483_10115 [Halothiobacillus sp.]|nr:hypothetical protein [Halothiobacillus sp.]